MITKEKKHEVVAELAESFEGVTGFYLVDFGGLSVKNTENFRRQLKAKGVSMRVAKNTLIRLALKQAGLDFEIPDDKFAGPSAVMITKDAATEPAKVMRDFVEKEKIDTLKLKAAVIEGQYYDGSNLKAIADLPTREDMIAGIMGSINAPASGIVGAINAVMRDVASLIEEVAKKNAA